jgi:hypothetical protein
MQVCGNRPNLAFFKTKIGWQGWPNIWLLNPSPAVEHPRQLHHSRWHATQTENDCFFRTLLKKRKTGKKKK